MPVRLSSVVGLVISTLLLVPGAQSSINPDEVEFITQADQAANASLLWGTYRPNLYFGTRPRLPESVMTGMMWFDASHLQGFQRM